MGRSLSWDALRSFLRHPAQDSALMRELNPEAGAWTTTAKTNAILAEIYDMLAVINSNLIAAATKKAAKRPKLYPRPGANDPDDRQHIGSGAMPPDELEKWFEEKRRERNARSSTGDADRDPGTGGRTAETDG